MVEQLIQMGIDFIEAQGMMAFVVVILAVLMYRDQTNRAIESKQQGDILTILREEVATNAANVANNTVLISKVDQLKTDLITEARSISDASTRPLQQTMDEIMTTVTPLEQALADIRDELQRLCASVDTHLANSEAFRDTVTAKTEAIENRLLQVEKTATQETPVTEPAAKVSDAQENKEKSDETHDSST